MYVLGKKHFILHSEQYVVTTFEYTLYLKKKSYKFKIISCTIYECIKKNLCLP